MIIQILILSIYSSSCAIVTGLNVGVRPLIVLVSQDFKIYYRFSIV